MMKKEMGFGTNSIHGGSVKNSGGTLITPIYQSSTFVFESAEQGGRRFAGEEEGYIYTRLGNPTSTVAEEKIAILEGGEAALATSSGMGAISATMWTLLKAGDHIIADKTLYGCTYAYLAHGLTKFGIDVEFVDTSNLDEVKRALKENTKLVYGETPANPNLKVVDLESLIKEVKSYNKDIMIVIDNTFATPYLQNPLKMGCDLVIHSATKYLNGHGDVIAGFVVGKKEVIDSIRLVGIKDMTGAVLSPNDSFLLTRGMKTLEIRMERHCDNGEKVAKFLETNEKITKVYYPGLPSHENHEVAKKQMKRFGGIIAFEVIGGFENGKKLLNNLKVCKLAVSLGDTETLIQHPASMTHSPYTREEREKAGIAEGLVRISVGLENCEDIIEDLEQALKKL